MGAEPYCRAKIVIPLWGGNTDSPALGRVIDRYVLQVTIV